MKQRDEPALIGVMIYDGTEPIDLGGTVGVVSMARRVLPNIESCLIAPRAGAVLLAGGVTVQAPFALGTEPDCDVTIVCGGPGWPQAAADPAVQAWLRSLPASRTASVCTGALILGAAGVLDGHRATTRRRAVGAEAASPLALLGRSGTVRTTEAAIVEDGGIVTGGGVSLAIDATLYLLGRIYGDAAARAVAEVIEYDRAWAANKAALGWVGG